MICCEDVDISTINSVKLAEIPQQEENVDTR